MGENKGQGLFHLAVALGGHGQLPPDDVPGMEAEPGHHQRIEALNAHAAPVAVQQPQSLAAKLPVVGAVLQLQNDGPPAPDHPQHIRQQGDALLRSAEPELLQLLEGIVLHPARYAADPLQRVIVEYHHLSVPAQMYVQLHAVALPGCQTESGDGVFRHGLIPGMKSPVGKVHPQKGGFLPPAGMTGGRKENRQRHGSRGAEKLGMIFQIWHLSLLH